MDSHSFTHYCGDGRGFVRIVWALGALTFALGTTPIQAGDAGAAVEVRLHEQAADHVVLDYEINDFSVEPVMIDGRKYAHIALGKESPMKIVGAPQLPNVCRSIIIPDDARMAVRVLASSHYDVADVGVAPSKGFIPRTVNPKDVPYTFGDVYDTDAFYPGELASLRDPYILRDHRGTVIELNPFQYNPVKRVLRVYTNVTVEVVRTGPGQINVLKRPPQPRGLSLAFDQIYSRQFLNYDVPKRYAPLDETGDMLIIAYDAWLSNIQPLVDHKNTQGINTTAVGVSTIGNNATLIKNYIQNIYNASDLAFVLLVGDANEVVSPQVTVGYETESGDPTYALLAGSDSYPEILVGRFSAQTAGQVDTQVERTIEYEQTSVISQSWFWRGTGVASSQGPGDDGEYDFQHLNNIRDDLLAYKYTSVDQIYDPGATAAQVTTALNAGRGIVNYTGHGGPYGWSTTGFSTSHVNALTNDNMLPFIISVACNNGTFDGYTCFAETWLRATHGSEPTGAIGIYASSVSQYWDPPMCGQDEVVDLLVAEAYTSFGALCFGGSCQMMDEYGSAGVDMYKTWHVFGDPSLRVLVFCSDQGTIELDREKYVCESVANISVGDCGLNTDSGLVETVTVTITSDSEPEGESVLLTETGAASAQFEGSIALSETDAAGVLLVAEGDTVTATYIDADDGQGGTNVTVTDTAQADCTPPQISNVQTIDIELHSATVIFDADEPAKGIVHYGEGCDALTGQATAGGYATAVAVNLTGLSNDTTYFYTVGAEDEAGNTSSDDNGGACYTFTTPDIPDFFTELFTNDNDLDNVMIRFTPNDSYEFYTACIQPITSLPVDPTLGTVLNLSDDDSEAVSLSGGYTVSLYGTWYSTFYVGSNGYLTFGSADNEYWETLGNHFNMPRISGLFDDLDSYTAGTVSWQQLEDRAVVTWLNMPEHGESSSNTFQIELYFNGVIRISFLDIAATDGLVGLSKGNGVDPDFSETDLSALGDCILDCNGNGIPDECDVDCGEPGGPCDIPGCGGSLDCNDNTIPDECEEDCNDNGVPDDCDISAGTSPDCNENGVPDECDITDGTSIDCDGNGVPDECECVSSTAPAPEPDAVRKNRYLSLLPGNAGCITALRVTLTDLPAPFDVLNGTTMWVSEPRAVSEHAGCSDGGTPPFFTGANLQSDPHCMDWNTVGLLHVFDDEIVPGGQYDIQAIHCECDPTTEENYSPALTVWTSEWGDLVGDCAVTPCTPPDGDADYNDITAVVDKFRNLPGAVIKARADLAGDLPDMLVNFVDISGAVDAFRGVEYPFPGP